VTDVTDELPATRNWIAAGQLREALNEFLTETKQELHDEVVKAEESSESENEWKARARRYRHNRDMIKEGFVLPEWSLEASLDEAEDSDYKQESESDGGSHDAESVDTEDDDDQQDGGRRAGFELASDDQFLRKQLHSSFKGGTELCGKSAFAEAIVACQDLYCLDSDGFTDDKDEAGRDEHIEEHVEQVQEGVQEERDEYLAGDAYGPANGDTELRELLDGLSSKYGLTFPKTAHKSAMPSTAEARMTQSPEKSVEEDKADEKAELEDQVNAKQGEMQEEEGATETEEDDSQERDMSEQVEESEEIDQSELEVVDGPDCEEDAEPEEGEVDEEPPQAQPTSPFARIDDEESDVIALNQDMPQRTVESTGVTPDYDAMLLPWRSESKKRRRLSTVSESSLDQGEESQKRQRRAARAEKRARLHVPAPLFLFQAMERTPSPSKSRSPPSAQANTTSGLGPAMQCALAAGGMPLLSNPLDLVPDGQMKQVFLSWFQAGYSLGVMQSTQERKT
jgi:hypothetical protein